MSLPPITVASPVAATASQPVTPSVPINDTNATLDLLMRSQEPPQAAQATSKAIGPGDYYIDPVYAPDHWDGNITRDLQRPELGIIGEENSLMRQKFIELRDGNPNKPVNFASLFPDKCA